VGPLLAWKSLEADAPFWPSIAGALHKIRKGKDKPFSGNTHEWMWSDEKGNDMQVVKYYDTEELKLVKLADGSTWDASCPLEEDYDISRLRRMCWMVWKEKIITKDRGQWSMVKEIRETPSQREWRKNLNLNWLEEWNSARSFKGLPRNLLFWWMDALHINLSARYTVDRCGVCSEVIRSAHFIHQCTGIKELRKRLKADTTNVGHRVIVCWCNWQLHVADKHGGESERTIGRAKKYLLRIEKD
jgi:hypothetical protein